MAYTSNSQVQKIIESDPQFAPLIDDESEEEQVPDFTPFVEAANALVEEVCAIVERYDDERLELIERYLAAHFYAMSDQEPNASQQGVSSISSSYQHRVDLGFNFTRFGQMAMRLDTEGGLAALEHDTKKGANKIGVAWLGKEDQLNP